MTLTNTEHAIDNGEPGGSRGHVRDCLVHAIRAEVRRGLDWQQTADGVATPRAPACPTRWFSCPRHCDAATRPAIRATCCTPSPTEAFSASAMVWLPGQQTMIHDHVAWCVTGVLQGHEYEEIFALADDGHRSSSSPQPGPARHRDGFAPPGASTVPQHR